MKIDFEERSHSVGNRNWRNQMPNILQPLLWLCGTFGIGLVYAITRTNGLIQQEIFVLIVILLLSTLAAYAYWSKKDPNRLQSENFRLDDRKLDIIERTGIASKGGFISDPEQLVPTKERQYDAKALISSPQSSENAPDAN